MRVLVTRPLPDAELTAATLRARGHAVTIAPLLVVESIAGAAVAVDRAQSQCAALLVTSAHAAETAARRLSVKKDLAVFAVGRHSADALRAVGFTHVSSADGDVEALARLVALRLSPHDGRLLYLCGEDRAGDLVGDLAARGFKVDAVPVYRAVAVEQLPADAVTALRDGLDAVLHYSPRSAAAFVAAVKRAGLAEAALNGPAQLCLSPRIAEVLKAAGATRMIKVAANPDETALLALVS